MIRISKWFMAGIVACFLCVTVVSSLTAATRVETRVRVIHASQGPHHIDSGISDLASELESVFRYTAYRLMQTRGMTLDLNQKGSVDLPGDRTLLVIPKEISGKRIQYQIIILKAKKTIFQTQVLLNNQSGITIGGPQHNNGYLLFNISGQVQ